MSYALLKNSGHKTLAFCDLKSLKAFLIRSTTSISPRFVYKCLKSIIRNKTKHQLQ